MKKSYCIICCILLMLNACHRTPSPQYVIGVSQCSDDAWRQRMNKELDTEQIFHPELVLKFRQANANSMLQCSQIDSFIAENIDLLIVCPNEAAEVQPAVTRAYRAGIPVVIADRRVSGSEWTAYIGGDNLQVGRELGKWVLSYARNKKDKLRVLEITGLPGSTPAVVRHRGMMEIIDSETDIQVKSLSGMWFADPAFNLVDSLLMRMEQPDIIVAQNDLMAIGAARACNRHGITVPILGVDGIAGREGGLGAILSGDITASALYPSRGDLILECASNILNGRAYARETHLTTMLVDREKAQVMEDMAELVDDELEDIRNLKNRINTLYSQQELQRALIYMLVTLLILMAGATIAAYQMIRYRARIHKERAEHEAQLQRQQQQLEQITEELKKTKEAVSEEEVFIGQLKRQIERHIDNPELGVEMLSKEMGMSRTVLFRKTKNVTGQSPIELINHIRLHKAKEMLEKTGMTVQQVAYSVGFSTPAYFSKKYKEEFGQLPSKR